MADSATHDTILTKRARAMMFAGVGLTLAALLMMWLYQADCSPAAIDQICDKQDQQQTAAAGLGGIVALVFGGGFLLRGLNLQRRERGDAGGVDEAGEDADAT